MKEIYACVKFKIFYVISSIWVIHMQIKLDAYDIIFKIAAST